MTDYFQAYLDADAADARCALSAAALITARIDWPGTRPDLAAKALTHIAGAGYAWLRDRATLHANSIRLVPGTPRKEGTPDMATVFNLADTDQVTFTLSAADAKGAPVDLPADTWQWSLADPDASGAVLTVADDGLSAVVAAGTPDANVMLSVAGSTTGLAGAEAIVIQATAAATIGLVAGSPAPETPAV